MTSLGAEETPPPPVPSKRQLNFTEQNSENMTVYPTIFWVEHGGNATSNCSDVVLKNSSDDVVPFGLRGCNATHVEMVAQINLTADSYNDDYWAWYGNTSETYLNSSWDEVRNNYFEDFEGYTIHTTPPGWYFYDPWANGDSDDTFRISTDKASGGSSKSAKMVDVNNDCQTTNRWRWAYNFTPYTDFWSYVHYEANWGAVASDYPFAGAMCDEYPNVYLYRTQVKSNNVYIQSLDIYSVVTAATPNVWYEITHYINETQEVGTNETATKCANRIGFPRNCSVATNFRDDGTRLELFYLEGRLNFGASPHYIDNFVARQDLSILGLTEPVVLLGDAQSSCTSNWTNPVNYTTCLNSTNYQFDVEWNDTQGCDVGNTTFNVTTYPAMTYSFTNATYTCNNDTQVNNTFRYDDDLTCGYYYLTSNSTDCVVAICGDLTCEGSFECQAGNPVCQLDYNETQTDCCTDCGTPDPFTECKNNTLRDKATERSLSEIGGGVGGLFTGMAGPIVVFIILLALGAAMGYLFSAISKQVGGKV
jgi:hypothetical protein